MRTRVAIGLLIAAIYLGGAVAADVIESAPAQPASAGPRAEREPVAVREEGLVAEYFAPATQQRSAAVLTIGGSEGGIEGARSLARAFAEEGYAALAVAYFGVEGLPEALQEIPIEYFAQALDWLHARDDVDPRRIAVVGVSKGAEAALILAAGDARVAALVAGVPSHVAWQNINFRDWTPRASWTRDGAPMAYVPYAQMKPWPLVDLYAASLAQHDAVAKAAIAVERIRGPVLLVSAGQDQIWPSQAMAEAIVARLAAAEFAHRVEHLTYPDAGHAVFGRPLPKDDPRAGQLVALGGTLEGNVAARADAWPKVVRFLRDAL